ncbi:MAG TPA: hypothetical protein VER03_25560 [Bryobacteraceae bacterium]|nr:hypothetical protein [Bryobacteraceae bacterium]
MACPYFYPISKAEGVTQPARAPLGALYDGRCEMGGAAGGDACNFGYAAGRCESFPREGSADAVRFSVLEGRTVFVLEKNCSPVRHGDAAALPGGALGRQAEVFGMWVNSR